MNKIPKKDLEELEKMLKLHKNNTLDKELKRLIKKEYDKV